MPDTPLQQPHSRIASLDGLRGIVLITLLLAFAISIFSYRYFKSYFLRLKR